MKMQGYNGSQCWDTTFAVQVSWRQPGSLFSKHLTSSLCRTGVGVTWHVAWCANQPRS